ncbi:MAG: NnrU family protein, partial [Candidatus Binatia bacterium]
VHLLPNGAATDVAFFGGLVLFPLIGCAHQDRRKLADDDGRFRRFYEATPFLPFTGQASLQGIRGLFPTALAVGVGLTIVVRYFHSSWFGG